MSVGFDVTLNGVALNTYGFYGFDDVQGLALNTLGFLWPSDAIWSDCDGSITTTWTNTAPSVTTVWTNAAPTISTTWTEQDQG